MISEIINWLNTNAGAVQAIATLTLVIITAYYAWQTKRNVQLLEKAEKESHRPRVAIYIIQREEWLNLIDLVIGNYGSGVARDIKFGVDDDLVLLDKEERLKDVEIINNGLPTLAPNQVIRIPLLSLTGRLDELQKKDITISLEYKDHSRKYNFTDKFPISFKSLVERQLGSPPIYKIAKEIESIKKAIEKISGDIHRSKQKTIEK